MMAGGGSVMMRARSCCHKPWTAEERKELQDEIKQAVLQAAQSAGNDVPADIKRMIKELTEPKLPKMYYVYRWKVL